MIEDCQRIATRGPFEADLEDTIGRQNFFLLYFCETGKDVSEDAKSVDDFTRTFLISLNRDTFEAYFPGLLVDDMIEKETKFELVRSPTLQTLKLNYEHNKVTYSTAVIFVTTEVEGRWNLEPLVYKNANKQADIYKTVF